MFKTFFAALVAVCLVALVLPSLGLAAILGPVGIVLWAVGLVLFGLLVLHRRRAAVVFLALLGVSVALSACGTVSGGQSGLAPVIDALARAGCAGNFSFGGGATTAAGLSPGSGHIENSFSGTCDPRNAKPVVAATDAAPQK